MRDLRLAIALPFALVGLALFLLLCARPEVGDETAPEVAG